MLSKVESLYHAWICIYHSGHLLECDVYFLSQLAWAPGRGVKGKVYKDFWDLESGASYIPWDKIPNEQELEKLTEGAWVMPETCPPGMKVPEMKREFLIHISHVCVNQKKK